MDPQTLEAINANSLIIDQTVNNPLMQPAMAPAMANDPTVFLGFMFAILAVMIIVNYFVSSIAYMKMAKKCKIEHAFIAWIPIADLFLVCDIAKKPYWWLLLIFFIPFVNIVFSIMLYYALVKRMNFHGAVTALLCIPIVNWVTMLVLAFSKKQIQA